FFIAIAGSLAFPQSGSVTVFALEITANWEPGHVGQWDFANTAEKAAKAGSGITIGIRKINRTDHEIAKLPDTGGPYGYEYDVRDSRGNSVKPKSLYHRGWITSGGPGLLRGTKDMVLEPGEAVVEGDSSVNTKEFHLDAMPSTTGMTKHLYTSHCNTSMVKKLR
ncbi:MAG TPA: hypothetical protein VJU82_10905, partial [Acidobacteriaceae bacterium]|nr:hypothetical protein [Acidobacteriaceae bacterium]